MMKNEKPDPRLDDVEATAERMLARYSTSGVAAEMAHWHAMDHPPGDTYRNYWMGVYGAIQRRRLGR
jgi:hypothetical protein